MIRTNQSRPTPSVPVVTNEEIAQTLVEISDLLERQGANPYRIRAYRQGAETVAYCPTPLQAILAERGIGGLMALRGIGDSLAAAIQKIIHAKRLPLLERLRGGGAPERLFSTVADIGPKLATRIHEQLGIRTLTQLEAAAWDGRLARVPGMGEKRIRAVRESIAGRFRRSANPTPPPVALPTNPQALRSIDPMKSAEVPRRQELLW